MEANSIDITVKLGGQVTGADVRRASGSRLPVSVDAARQALLEYLRSPQAGGRLVPDAATVTYAWADRGLSSALAQYRFAVKRAGNDFVVDHEGTRDPLMSTTRFDAVDKDGVRVQPSIRGASAFVDPTPDQARQNVENAIPVLRRPTVHPKPIHLKKGTAVVSFQRFSDQVNLPTAYRIEFDVDGDKVTTKLVGTEPA